MVERAPRRPNCSSTRLTCCMNVLCSIFTLVDRQRSSLGPLRMARSGLASRHHLLVSMRDNKATAAAPAAQMPRYPNTDKWMALALVCWIISLLYVSRRSPLVAPSPPSSFTSLRIGSFNIRYDGRASEPVPLPSHPPPSDNKRKWGEQPWSERLWLVADSILWSDSDLVGLQEVLHGQMEDLQQLLGEKWGSVGVGELSVGVQAVSGSLTLLRLFRPG